MKPIREYYYLRQGPGVNPRTSVQKSSDAFQNSTPWGYEWEIKTRLGLGYYYYYHFFFLLLV